MKEQFTSLENIMENILRKTYGKEIKGKFVSGKFRLHLGILSVMSSFNCNKFVNCGTLLRTSECNKEGWGVCTRVVLIHTCMCCGSNEIREHTQM